MEKSSTSNTDEYYNYQKILEKRVEILQEKLEKECISHDADNKKYMLAFHNLLKDVNTLGKTLDYLDANISYGNIVEVDKVKSVSIDIIHIERILKDLTAFHDKYSDKSYAFLKEIIAKG